MRRATRRRVYESESAPLRDAFYREDADACAFAARMRMFI